MTTLNWKDGLGNVTLDTTAPISVPFQIGRAPIPIPDPSTAQPDEYGIYFLVEKVDPETKTVTFKKDSDGFKIPFGFTSYRTSNTDDHLIAIGYLPGSFPGGAYSNALSLTTIRLGDGNDTFTLGGRGITQSLSAEVNKEASQGYIFQSNIFAGAGDDTIVALMPWQSVLKGGQSTSYSDIILSDALTLEEVSFGDTIELKGSRFDWDIEFKDGNGDDQVTLASILDGRDYIATSNNNRIYEFERIRFGDLFFDLVLYEQLDSNVVYGQPDYYLIGSEPQAPELNSNITSGSKLWEAFRFNRTKLGGITGTATSPISVNTGDAGDTPFIVGALRFATLNTEAGNDIVVIGTAEQIAVDQASINLGVGTDQLKVNGLFSRSSVTGGDGADNIILSTVTNSTVDGGEDNDVVEVTTSISQSIFTGGTGNDVLILPGSYAIYLLTSSTAESIITFSDDFGNSITGFETLRFNDINLDALQQLSLSGPTTIDEGSTAAYTISLNGGSGLTAGESVAFSLQLSGSGSNPTNVFTDLAALITDSLQASAGIALKNISINSKTGLIRGVASAIRNLGAGMSLATLSVPVNGDLLTESAESFQVTLRDFGALIPASQQVTTTIADVAPVAIKLTAPSSSVIEGTNAAFKVSLDGVGLANGRSITFTLDTASGSASEGTDFARLIFGDLTSTLTMGSPVTDPVTGAVTLTVTNNTGDALSTTADLLTFNIRVNADTTIEGTESFSVALSSPTAIVSSGVATTSIADLVVTPEIQLIGEDTVREGENAAYAVVLNGTSLAAGQSLSFSLDTKGLAAIEGTDFAALLASNITAAADITLSAISTDPITKEVTLTTTNTSSSSLPAGRQIVTFSVNTSNDLFSEADESFRVNLSSTAATVSVGALTTSISDNDVAVIKLTGNDNVAEGATAAYAVPLDGVGLGAGRSITFSLDSVGISASEDTDFAALASSSLTASSAQLALSVNPPDANGTVSVTITNNGADLAADSQLLSFSLVTSDDLLSEGDETFSISLTGKTGSNSTTVATGAGLVSTTITDNDPAAIRLTGPSSIAEGDTARYAVALDGVGLGTGRSIPIWLFTGISEFTGATGTATESSDFVKFLARALNAENGIILEGVSTDAVGIVSATVTSTKDLDVGASLLTFSLGTLPDAVAELAETFQLNLGSLAAVKIASLQTTITDATKPVIRLTGPAAVTEGSPASFGVVLDEVALGSGRSITFSIDSQGLGDVTGLSATQGKDLAALAAANIKATASGISLSAISTDSITGAITLTATNTLLTTDVAAGSQLVSFELPTTTDTFVEGNETFSVTLSNSTASLAGGTSTQTITTTIRDDNPSVVISGSSSNVNPAAQALAGTIKAIDLKTGELLSAISAATVTSLAQLTTTTPVTPAASAFLDRFTIVDPGSGTTRKASAADAGLLDFTLQAGYLSTTIIDVQLALEVEANSYVKINPNTGEAFDFTFDPITRLGAELLDINSNGLVDTIRLHLQDGELGDTDGKANGEIRDPGLLANAPRSPIYRFYSRSGVHFYTDSAAERDNIIKQSYGVDVSFADLSASPQARDPITGGWGYKYEGIAYQALETQGTALYRFYNPGKECHFFTTSAGEALNVIKNSIGPQFDLSNAQGQRLLSKGWGYQYEGTTFKVSTIGQTGMDMPVYRFYNTKKGAHFYSSSIEEAKLVIANSLGSQYASERWITSTSNALSSGFTTTPAPLADGWGYAFEGIAWYADY